VKGERWYRLWSKVSFRAIDIGLGLSILAGSTWSRQLSRGETEIRDLFISTHYLGYCIFPSLRKFLIALACLGSDGGTRTATCCSGGSWGRSQTRRYGISGVLEELGATIPRPQSGYPSVECGARLVSAHSVERAAPVRAGTTLPFWPGERSHADRGSQRHSGLYGRH
jgi:hypothetical protein